MLPRPLSLLVLSLISASPLVDASLAGSFTDGGNTLVSAMMMFVGNEEKVYILDKAEGNSIQVAGHPAWASIWDFASRQANVMDVPSNTFCASGMHLPNGSFVTFGGNGAVGPGGNIGSSLNPGGFSANWDAQYQDFDGTKAIRILNPCRNSDDFTSANCQWYDNPAALSMKSARWYSAAEPTGEGSIVIIGGFTAGGYVNRNFTNTDPLFEGGAANPTYEFFPAVAGDPPIFQFMGQTSGLNAYAHTFLMPSGKMFVQANLSSVLWDYNANVETPLPDMPNGVVRVYPASGAVAMLPLTPANNYTPTILFCGGSNMPADAYGNYSFPFIDTWNYPASQDCQRITPEPQDGSSPVYTQDDNMLEGRTMGQFIILPTGKLLVLNGGQNGTAGYAVGTLTTPANQMPFGPSLASGPIGTPAIYDPSAAPGQRWSSAGLGTSSIARLYHSSALLLPDASVLVAGSNPNMDVNLTTVYPTTYAAEIFYPPYFLATTRPVPQNVPTTLSYGGNPFDIAIPASSYGGSSNQAANTTTVVLIRSGFTTHAMNMGQRYMQLNNTYTVNSDGSIVLHVAQLPPNPNLFQPGPAFLYVNIAGIPSNGTYVIIGNGQIGPQPTAAVSILPPNVLALDSVSGTATSSSTNGTLNGSTSETEESKTSSKTIIGAVIGGVAVLAIVGGLIGFFIRRRKRGALTSANRYPGTVGEYAMATSGVGAGAGMSSGGLRDARLSDATPFAPLQQNSSEAWAGSTASLSSPGMHAPYRDEEDLYARPMQPQGQGYRY